MHHMKQRGGVPYEATTNDTHKQETHQHTTISHEHKTKGGAPTSQDDNEQNLETATAIQLPQTLPTHITRNIKDPLQAALHEVGFKPSDAQLQICINDAWQRLTRATKLKQQVDLLIGAAKRIPLHWETTCNIEPSENAWKKLL